MPTKVTEDKYGFIIKFNETQIENSTLKFENAKLRSELEELKEDLFLRIHKHNDNCYTMIPNKRITQNEYNILKRMLKETRIK